MISTGAKAKISNKSSFLHIEKLLIPQPSPMCRSCDRSESVVTLPSPHTLVDMHRHSQQNRERFLSDNAIRALWSVCGDMGTTSRTASGASCAGRGRKLQPSAGIRRAEMRLCDIHHIQCEFSRDVKLPVDFLTNAGRVTTIRSAANAASSRTGPILRSMEPGSQ